MAYPHESAAGFPPVPPHSSSKLAQAQGHGTGKPIPKRPTQPPKHVASRLPPLEQELQQLPIDDQLQDPENPYEYGVTDTPSTHNVSSAPTYHGQQTSNPSGAVGIELRALDIGNDRDATSISSFSSSATPSNAPTVEHYNISFEFKKTFRQHKGVKLFNLYDKCLKKTYEYSVWLTYHILLVPFGLLFVVIWGIVNALTSCIQAWFMSPFTRVSLVLIQGLLPLVLEPLRLVMGVVACDIGSIIQGVIGVRGGAATQRV